MHHIPKLFKIVPQTCQGLPLPQGFGTWLQKLALPPLVFSWLDLRSNVTSSKRSSIPTYSHSLTHHLVHYGHSSCHCLESSCACLLTYLSISALTIYSSSLTARTRCMLFSEGPRQGLAHCRYSINSS